MVYCVFQKPQKVKGEELIFEKPSDNFPAFSTSKTVVVLM